jgi:hypothetical protein
MIGFSLRKGLDKSDLAIDDIVSWPPDGDAVESRPLDWARKLTILALVITATVFILAAWNDTFSRFQEFEKQIDPYKTEIYYFIPIGSAFVAACFLGAKRWNKNLLPFSVSILLLVGIAIGSNTLNRQNSHRYGTDTNGPVSLEDIAFNSPQIQAQETFLTYMKLREFLDDTRVFVHRNTSFKLYLNGFSGANVKIDWDFDTTKVPFDRMTGMKILLEGPIYKDRRLLLFGEGDSYHFYTTPQTDYLVADR